MDDRVVRVRTSQSAEDFWSRVRHSGQYDKETLKVRTSSENERPPPLIPMLPTPYSLQQRPFADPPLQGQPVVRAPPPPPPSPIRNPLTDSRRVERHVLAREIDFNDCLQHNNAALRCEVERTRRQLMAVLRINHNLTGQMVANARP